MRPALLAWALAAVISTSIAAPPGIARSGTAVSKDAGSGEAGEDVEYTTFNDIEVPPMVEIEGGKFAETIKDGYW